MDIIISDYKALDFSLLQIPIIVLYDHPLDYPENYTARVWDGNKPTNAVMLEKNLDKLRNKIPSGMVNVRRSNNDDGCIIETWI